MLSDVAVNSLGKMASPVSSIDPDFLTLFVQIKKGKGSFYIAQYPVRWAAQHRFTLCASPGRLVHSDTNSASPGSILARQQLRAKAKSLIFPPLSIARYPFIQLSEQGRQWRERKCPIFETVAKRDSNPGSLDCESGILPLSYRAPQNVVRLQSCPHRCLSGFLCTHIIFIVLAMMSILLGFVLSQMPFRNPRKQHTVVYVVCVYHLFVQQ